MDLFCYGEMCIGTFLTGMSEVQMLQMNQSHNDVETKMNG